MCLHTVSGERERTQQSLHQQGLCSWSSGSTLPLQALGHQVCLVGIHDERELIDEVISLDEAFQPPNHGHPAVLEHDHGQERVRVLPQSLGHCNRHRRHHPSHKGHSTHVSHH